MAFSTSSLAIRASRHLTLCLAMALIFCGSSSCHFHSSSSGHDHSAHCDENHVDEDETCDPEGAPPADDGAPGTPGPGLVVAESRVSSLRQTFLSHGQALHRVRSLAAGQGPLGPWTTNAPVLLSVVVSDEFLVVNLSQGTSPDDGAPVTGPGDATADTATRIELVFDRHGLLLASSPGLPRSR